MLTEIFRSRGEEVTGGWRKLHNEEIRDYLYSSAEVTLMIKSRRKRQAGCLDHDVLGVTCCVASIANERGTSRLHLRFNPEHEDDKFLNVDNVQDYTAA